MKVAPGSVPLDFRPSTEAELVRCLSDPIWRVASGALYWITVKSETVAGGNTKIPFRPNRSQRRFIRSLHYRNIVLKGRQLGFTTLIAIMFLDHALFNPDQRVGMIAHDGNAAGSILRDKVKFAYENLPEQLKAAMPLVKDSASELLFGHNNSSIRVATSVRSATIHRLHVSEFAKICAKYPDKAHEVVTGSLPAVPADGIVIIESTAEGQEGAFFDMTMTAMADAESKKALNPLEYRFMFFAWWQAEEYQMDPAGVVITPVDHEYFDLIEAKIGRNISLRQRAWYCATRKSAFGGAPEKMWQEYPSTEREAFQQSMEGTYYAQQLALARQEKRISTIHPVLAVPVNTFWDIGASDGTGLWLHQQIGAEHRFIGYIEGWGEPYEFFVRKLQALPYVWGTHYLPHDATHSRQLYDKITTPLAMLEAAWTGQRFEVIPPVDELQFGIQAVRTVFGQCWFDETSCADGLRHLSLYRKTWNDKVGAWSDTPRKDAHTEAADSFRQFAQKWKSDGGFNRVQTQIRHRRSAMAA